MGLLRWMPTTNKRAAVVLNSGTRESRIRLGMVPRQRPLSLVHGSVPLSGVPLQSSSPSFVSICFVCLPSPYPGERRPPSACVPTYCRATYVVLPTLKNALCADNTGRGTTTPPNKTKVFPRGKRFPGHCGGLANAATSWCQRGDQMCQEKHRPDS